MELIYNPCEYELMQAIRAKKEAKAAPDSKSALRERDAKLSLALLDAIIASGGLAYFHARCAASSNPRATYLEMCAEFGVEAATAPIDP